MHLATIAASPAASALGLIWRPMLEPMHIVGIAAVLAGLAIAAYVRTWRQAKRLSVGLLAMRLALIAAMATILWGPSSAEAPDAAPRRPRLHVLVDTSQSMQTTDAGGRSRIDAACRQWLSPRWLADVEKTADVTVVGFDESVRPVAPSQLAAGPLAAEGQSTRLAECVRTWLGQCDAGEGRVSLLVLSDGRDLSEHALQPVGLLAKARSVPIDAACFGTQRAAADLTLTASPAQRYLLAGTEGSIRVQVVQQGLEAEIRRLADDGKAVNVHIEDGRGVRSVPLKFDADGQAVADLSIREDAPGQHGYRVWVDELAGEVESGNNSQHVFVDVTTQPLRALLLEGEPFWETKFAAQALRRDSRIRLTQISQVSGTKKTIILNDPNGPQQLEVPTSAADFRGYDLIILGRGIENVLPQPAMDALPAYVADQGGALIFARGRAYDERTSAGRLAGRALAVLEPVVWGQGVLHNLSLTPTAEGRRAFLGEALPGMADIQSRTAFTVMPAAARVKTAARVLAWALEPGRSVGSGEGGQPAMVVMDYGRGRVLAVMGEGLWRWGLGHEADDRTRGNAYEQLWSAMAGWLAMGSEFGPGQDRALLLSRTGIARGEEVLVESLCRQEPPGGFRPEVRMTGPDGVEQLLSLSPAAGSRTRLQAEIRPERAGVYTVVASDPGGEPARIERRFSVSAVTAERLKSAADPQALATLAESSGGRLYRPEQAEDFVYAQAAAIAAARSAVGYRYLWDQWMVLVLVLVWAGLEWIIRKASGLL